MNIKKLTQEAKKTARLYSKKFDVKLDGDWYVLKLQEELGELTQSYLMKTERAKLRGLSKEKIEEKFKEELADLFAITLLLADHFDIDIEKEVERKWLSWTNKDELKTP